MRLFLFLFLLINLKKLNISHIENFQGRPMHFFSVFDKDKTHCVRAIIVSK